MIVKRGPNAFKDTPLEAELRELGVDEVVLCGMMTSMCVDASARARGRPRAADDDRRGRLRGAGLGARATS